MPLVSSPASSNSFKLGARKIKTFKVTARLHLILKLFKTILLPMNTRGPEKSQWTIDKSSRTGQAEIRVLSVVELNLALQSLSALKQGRRAEAGRQVKHTLVQLQPLRSCTGEGEGRHSVVRLLSTILEVQAQFFNASSRSPTDQEIDSVGMAARACEFNAQFLPLQRQELRGNLVVRYDGLVPEGRIQFPAASRPLSTLKSTPWMCFHTFVHTLD